MKDAKIIVGTLDEHIYTLSQSLEIISKTPAKNASFLHLADDDLYTTSELPDSGGIRKFTLTDNKWIEKWHCASSGAGTAHLTTATGGDDEYLLCANYVGHTLDLFTTSGILLQSIQINGSGPFEGRQEGSHPHFVSQHEGVIYLCDLGGDKIHTYILKGGELSEVAVIRTPPGSGPRHLAFGNKMIYCLCELSNEVLILNHNEIIQKFSILPHPSLATGKHADFEQPASGGEIALYGGNLITTSRFLPRDTDVIQICTLKDGMYENCKFYDLKDRAPWHFDTMDGVICIAFQWSNMVVLYNLDDMTEIRRLEIPSPSCVKFMT